MGKFDKFNLTEKVEIPEPYYTVHTDQEKRPGKTTRYRGRITCLFDGKLNEIFVTHWYNELYLRHCQGNNPIQFNIAQAFDFIRAVPTEVLTS